MMKRPQGSKNSKWAWAASWFSLPVIILSVAFSFPAQAAGVRTLTYDVYASGFRVVQAELKIDTEKENRYKIFLSGHTRGFLKSLAPWEGTFETAGWIGKDAALQPEMHKSTAVWRGKPDIKEYFYGSDGNFKGFRVTDSDKPAQDKDVEDELTQGTIDVLTASLEMMQNVAGGSDCTGISEVFDGKRRFKMIFNHEGRVNLQSSRYNIYEGPAVKCTVEVKPIAGKWHKKPRGWLSIQEQGRSLGTMPTVWVGKMDGEDDFALPVKVFVKTSYGSLFMHLTGYQNGDEILMADKHKE